MLLIAGLTKKNRESKRSSLERFFFSREYYFPLKNFQEFPLSELHLVGRIIFPGNYFPKLIALTNMPSPFSFKVKIKLLSWGQ